MRSPQNLINAVRGFFGNLTATKALAAGVVFAECAGFFSVGEILGRLKLVGYHGEPPAAHH
jgi:F-type H+-transporting ATPase subunit g